VSEDAGREARLRIGLRNDLAEVARVDGAVLEYLQGRGTDERRIYRSRLVLEEILTNVIRHGCSDGREHEISVELGADEQSVSVRVVDDGRPFDPRSAPAFDVAAPLEARSGGGMGIHLVRSIARCLRYERTDGRNLLELTL
jgi:anti-sigma regulatory factor (Ser/Thr protein kinase)